jgi:hypothetical protein
MACRGVVAATLGAFVLLGTSSCAGSAAPMSHVESRPSYHAPASPGDAAAEFVTLTTERGFRFSSPLDCRGLNYGAFPLAFDSAPADVIHFTATQVEQLGPSRWRVHVARISWVYGQTPWVVATVVRVGRQYTVCMVH